MHRIDTPNAAPALPAQTAPGTPGFFDRGDPNTGNNATELSQDWCNATQEEIVGIVAGGGVALSRANNNQAVQAIRRIAGGNASTLSASAALTVDGAGLVLIDATAGPVTITLPLANVLGGVRFRFVRTDGTTNAVTIQRAGADQIDGITALTLGSQYQTVQMVADGGTNWYTDAAPRLGPEVPAGYIRAGNYYMLDDLNLNQLSPHTNLSAPGVWESFGPTGSGAAHIWNAMDGIPAGATAVRLSVFLSVSNTGGIGPSSFGVSFRRTGATFGPAPFNGLDSAGDVSASGFNTVNLTVDVPIDAARRFDALWGDPVNVTINPTSFMGVLGFYA